MTDIRTRAIAIYDAFTHEHCDRRTMLREMTLLAGSAAAAQTLIAGIAASPAAAQQVPADDARLIARRGVYPLGRDYPMRGYFAVPRQRPHVTPGIMVIHENRGLNAHIEDVARRLALAGYAVVAPDFLSPAGGTPDDEDRARDMIGGLDLAEAVDNAIRTMKKMQSLRRVSDRIGAVGFCWGGGMVNRVAVAAKDVLSAGVSYYGPAPDPAEAEAVSAPMLFHFAGNDARVNATGGPWVEALHQAGKEPVAYTYEGVDHAFNNDTSEARYDAEAAALAWQRTLGFFERHLTAPTG
jgi:carboxymethylenebutenolidase